MADQEKHGDDGDEKDVKENAELSAMPQVRQVRSTPAGMKRIRLTRSIVLSGEHEDVGSVHDVSAPLAQRLIGEGSAVHHLEEGQMPAAQASTVNRMESPSNRDPKSIPVSRPAPKVKQAGQGKK
jgi:hypothetical protein